jgi:thiamine-monophosphate kinase
VCLDEFELIRRFFSEPRVLRDDVTLGIGDDCALVRIPQGMQLALTMDTLVEGVHFFADVDPEALGHKALAVNLSDLAAMGASPAWATLGLTLPHADVQWLQAFSRGFANLAKRYGVQLIGGDTTRGPLTITVQAHGLLPVGQGLRRAGAEVGDLIFVTGTLGDAGLALQQNREGLSWQAVAGHLKTRLERPEPRIDVGLALRDIATAAIDISDGLWADLGHILQASHRGAQIRLERLPLSTAVAAALQGETDWALALTSGDDYELCFTLPGAREQEISRISKELGLPITQVGQIEAAQGLRCLQPDGRLWQPDRPGYLHFYANA